MRILDYIVLLIIAVVLIVGAYQFYFLPQRKPARSPILFHTKYDDQIPFKPAWVWIYSALYYPAILFLALTVNTFREFNYTAFSFIALLVLQLISFYFIPVRTPENWRDYNSEINLSTKFLAFVQKIDSPSNCFPSMHVSVATLTAFHLHRTLQPIFQEFSLTAFLFPILISLSSLYTKQHYIIDIPGGFVFGYIGYKLFVFFYF